MSIAGTWRAFPFAFQEHAIIAFSLQTALAVSNDFIIIIAFLGGSLREVLLCYLWQDAACLVHYELFHSRGWSSVLFPFLKNGVFQSTQI